MAILRRMTNSIAHRGPDGEGHWVSQDGKVCLGQRRLAVIDLSDAGSQPMISHSGRFTIVFNGEIYGYQDIRQRLIDGGTVFRGHSDTEVLLELIDAVGLEEALATVNGMFAFVLFDQEARKVHFARDRLGKKPLYIGVLGSHLLFGSELKALRSHPAMQSADIDRGALSLYLRHNFIPAPYSIYKDVFKLQAGHWLTVSVDSQCSPAPQLRESSAPYWDLVSAVTKSRTQRLNSEQESLERLDTLLKTAVRERLVSDVPVGAFLSGGIDSTLIAALMTEVSSETVKTFTIGYNEAAFNEAEFAAEIARYLGVEHTELTATPQMAIDLVQRLPVVYDEPFADPSQVPTLLLSEMTSNMVTVALSGDGGDESFCGYARYHRMLTINRLAQKIPNVALSTVDKLSASWIDTVLKLGRGVITQSLRDEVSGDRIKKLAQILTYKDFDSRYREFVSQWSDPADIVIDGYEPQTNLTRGLANPEWSDQERMMCLDSICYLPDDVLVKVDRATMAFGLELRSPLLDYRIVEEAWRAPRSLCFSQGKGKIALRKLLARRIPVELFERPKQGFSVPINEWLRGPLREWATDMLCRDRLVKDGYFRADKVTKYLQEHLSGERNWGPHLWTALMFNAWNDVWVRSDQSALTVDA